MPRLFSQRETFELEGPVSDGSTDGPMVVVYCSVECAEEDNADEDALHEVNADEGERCPVCKKVIVNVPAKEVQ